jgi:branched-chain amino acid transport system permease protein
MDITTFLQLVISGVLLGGIYALVAFGLSLVYGVVKILNFSHGTLLAVGGIAASLAYTQLGLPPWVSVLVLVVVFGLFGRVFYEFLLEPLTRRSHTENEVGTVLVTVGALLMMGDIAAYFAGPTPQNIPLRFEPIEIGDLLLSTTQVYALGGILVLTVLLQLFLTYSWFGRAIRAVSQDARGAAICGIPGRSLHGNTFAFGCSLVAVASVLYAMMFPVDPFMGFSLTVKAFTIIVLGGIGNLTGSLVAGVLLGVAESLAAYVIGSAWAPGISIMLLLVILVVRPQGLFGGQSA